MMMMSNLSEYERDSQRVDDSATATVAVAVAESVPNTRFHPHHHTSQHNQSEINYSNQSSNTLFKNKAPVDYKVISTQHAIPELEHGADVNLRTTEMSHLINLGMQEKGLGGFTSQSYTGIKEVIA